MKTTVITGAGTGIGRAIAMRLAKEGHNLALLARNASRLETVATQIKREHPVGVFLQSPERLQLDGAWAVHQPVELLGEPRQIAGVCHRVEHQTLVPLVGAAVQLHACS